MNKTIPFLIILLNFMDLSYSQCSFSELFPLKFGSTKYESLLILKNIPNLNEENIYLYPQYRPANVLINESKRWAKQEYLLNDSIHLTNLFYTYKYNPCFLTHKGSLRLVFADDKLYAFEIYITFPENQLTVFEENFIRLKELVNKEYPFLDYYHVSDIDTRELKHESYEFYKTENESKLNKKEFIRIDPKKMDNEISILYINLKITKFNKGGFSL